MRPPEAANSLMPYIAGRRLRSANATMRCWWSARPGSARTRSASARSAVIAGKGKVQLIGALHSKRLQLHPQHRGCGLRSSQQLGLEDGIVRIPEDCDARNSGRGFPQQLQRFPHDLSGHTGRAGHVCTRVPQACDQPRAHGIRNRYHDNRNGVGCVLCGERGLGHYSNDYIHVEPDELRCKLGQPIKSSFRKPVLNSDSRALDIAEIAQRLPECLVAALESGQRQSRATSNQSSEFSPLAARAPSVAM